MNHSTLILSGVLCAFLSGCATTPDRYTTADTDNSGAIGPAEFDAYMKKAVFETIDANQDGKITMEEWKLANPSAATSKFRGADSNRDGMITRGEGDAAFDRKQTIGKLFRQIDTDGDGTLSRAETEAFQAAVSGQSGSTQLEKLSHSAH